MIRLVAGIGVIAFGLWLLMGCSRNPYYGMSHPYRTIITAKATVIPCDLDNCGKQP
jgi:hypothetical protein